MNYIESVTGSLPILAVFDTLRRNMSGGVSQEEPTSAVLNAVNDLQTRGIAVTLIAHHGRGHKETKGLTEWEDDADQVRIYDGAVRDGYTTIEMKKVKGAEDGWSLAVEYTNHELPDGNTTMVAATGQRMDRGKSGRSTNEHLPIVLREDIALEILKGCDRPKMRRKDLAREVCRRLSQDLEQDDPEKFRLLVNTVARDFGRMKRGELFQCAADRGVAPNHEILSFNTPNQQSRRPN